MARSRTARSILLASALLALALPALAREDDAEFVFALADRGYEDLAQKEIQRMLEGSPTPEKRENAEYARCMLLRRTALVAAGSDKAAPGEVREKFAAAGKAYDAFLKAFPNSTKKAEAEFNMANLMKDFAYYLTKSKDKFAASEQDAVAQEAGKTFEEAIRYLTSIKDREQQRDQEKEDEDETKFLERNKAWYFLCVAMHDRAMLLPAGDALRTQQFTHAIEETTKFLEETDGTLFGYLASWWMGQMYWHRAEQAKGWASDDIKFAREMFDSTMSAADIPGLEQEWPNLVEIVFQAAYDFGRMCNQVGTLDGTNFPKLFADKMAQLEEKLPSARSTRWGLQCFIEKARSMAATGMAEAAVALLNQVSDYSQNADPSWGRAVDQEAKRALNEVLAAIPPDSPLELGADILFKAGEGSLRDGNFGRAVRAYQRVLLTVSREADPERRRTLLGEYFGNCWVRINECYGRMDRWLEAYYAADYPVQRYLAEKRSDQDQVIADLAYYRTTALETVLKRLPKDAPKELRDDLVSQVKKARELLTEKFDWSDRSTSAAYQVAAGKLSAATSLVAAGDREKAAGLFREAIDLFGKLDPKDPMYKFAQSRIGECLVQMGKAEEGLKFLQAFTTNPGNLEDWKAGPARGRQPLGWATFWTAMAHDQLGQPAKVVEALEGFEKRFEGATLENSFPRVRYLRIQGLVKSGRGAEAEKECDLLRKETPDAGFTPLACLVVANDLKSRGDKAHAANDRKVEAESKKRAVDFYDFWIRRSENIVPEQYTFVGQLCYDVGNFDRAAELWQRALDLYEKAGNRPKVEQMNIYLAQLLVGQGRYAEALPKLELLFVKTPEEVAPLREVFEALRRRPTNVPADVHQKKVKDMLEKVGAELAKDPAGAGKAGEAKRAAAGGDTEILVRAYADTPEERRALARAASLTILGNDALMSQDLKIAVFSLVKRTPDLMTNLARCYEELANQSPENPIRAVNLYSTLIEAAPDDTDAPGSKYSERWFEWKYRWAKVYLTTGVAYKSEPWLKIVCDIVRGMDTLGELKRAEKEREGFSKEFASLRDQADAALRAIGKEGCK